MISLGSSGMSSLEELGNKALCSAVHDPERKELFVNAGTKYGVINMILKMHATLAWVEPTNPSINIVMINNSCWMKFIYMILNTH